MLPSRLLTEASVVGMITASALVAKFYFLGADRGPMDVFLKGFLIGAAIHLTFEAVGANTWYCTHGTACSGA